MKKEPTNSEKPITTCNNIACEGCDIENVLHCHFTLRDLMLFYVIVFPSFLVGGIGIYNVAAWWLLPWVAIIVGYFGFLEIRVMCSHCPHYAEPGRSLTCWANYGSPKIWKYRPGPMLPMEKGIFIAGLLLVWGYPLPFFIYNFQWFLLIIYLLATALFFMVLKMFFCAQCMNFACPLNGVKEEVRHLFFAHNPVVADAWGDGEKRP